ncbi:hypothetical protein KSP39_PZI011699 [Platanthera zijinensis]|uniref:Uncharacterized protein n=1 Tax=Platanthera zijinensis TaxID=2320716 RepID=A0AAP0G648_9ASPA
MRPQRRPQPTTGGSQGELEAKARKEAPRPPPPPPRGRPTRSLYARKTGPVHSRRGRFVSNLTGSSMLEIAALSVIVPENAEPDKIGLSPWFTRIYKTISRYVVIFCFLAGLASTINIVGTTHGASSKFKGLHDFAVQLMNDFVIVILPTILFFTCMQGGDSGELVESDAGIEQTLRALRCAPATWDDIRNTGNEQRGEDVPLVGQTTDEHDVIRPRPQMMREYTTPTFGSVYPSFGLVITNNQFEIKLAILNIISNNSSSRG